MYSQEKKETVTPVNEIESTQTQGKELIDWDDPVEVAFISDVVDTCVKQCAPDRSCYEL